MSNVYCETWHDYFDYNWQAEAYWQLLLHCRIKRSCYIKMYYRFLANRNDVFRKNCFNFLRTPLCELDAIPLTKRNIFMRMCTVLAVRLFYVYSSWMQPVSFYDPKKLLRIKLKPCRFAIINKLKPPWFQSHKREIDIL